MSLTLMFKLVTRLLPVFLLATFSAASFAQTDGSVADPSQAQESTQILEKLHKLDLLNHLLPVIWTKAEAEKMVESLDTVRETVRKEEKIEFTKLAELEPRINKAYTEATTNGAIPGRKLVNDVNQDIIKMKIARSIIARSNEDLVYKALTDALTDAQKKAVANSLIPAEIDPSLKPETMTQEDKIRLYVKTILLDPLSYDLLRKIEELPSAQ